MEKYEVDDLVKKYAETEGVGSTMDWSAYSTQYDNRSAAINYSFVRHFKPKVVIEFGTRTGRCTHDILRALLKNGGKFVFKPYEMDKDLRKTAQGEIDRIFGDKSVSIGGDITLAKDVPDGIDYAFIDNFHDLETTKWVLETLLPKCKPGALIQIHDWALKDNWELTAKGVLEETLYLGNLHKEGKLPLTKLYWAIDEGDLNCQSSWFVYNPL